MIKLVLTAGRGGVGQLHSKVEYSLVLLLSVTWTGFVSLTLMTISWHTVRIRDCYWGKGAMEIPAVPLYAGLCMPKKGALTIEPVSL